MDFGIRGLDLAYALGQPYDAAILVDAVAAGGPPGCLQVIEPDHPEDETSVFDGHRMNPLAVLRLARRLGGLPPQVFLVGCEPRAIAESESMSMGLSAPVAAAVERPPGSCWSWPGTAAPAAHLMRTASTPWRAANKRSIEMRKTIFYTITVFSAVLLAKKFVPSLIRELKQEFM